MISDFIIMKWMIITFLFNITFLYCWKIVNINIYFGILFTVVESEVRYNETLKWLQSKYYIYHIIKALKKLLINRVPIRLSVIEIIMSLQRMNHQWLTEWFILLLSHFYGCLLGFKLLQHQLFRTILYNKIVYLELPLNNFNF